MLGWNIQLTAVSGTNHVLALIYILEEDRIGGGHPEGLFEAWSNLYRRFAVAMDATDRGDESLLKDHWYPDVHAGLRGVRWVENCVRSADNGASWVEFQ